MPLDLQGAFRKPFKEQQTFFRRKLVLPSERWDDILRDQHDKAFIVAGATKADLVADLKGSIQKVIDEGKSIQWFRENFAQIVQKYGWADFTGSDTPGGVAWRTRTIYTTNLKTSYAAGRYAQMTDPDVLRARPYWRYRHRTIENPRLEHKSWNDLVLPAQHPWFNTHYAPNGFGCNCIIDAINERQLRALGKTSVDQPPNDGTYEHVVRATGELHTLPKGVQYGWDYTPGRSATEEALQARVGRLDTLDADVTRLHVNSLVQSVIFQRFFSGQLDGKFPLGVLTEATQAKLRLPSGVVLSSQRRLASHLQDFPELVINDYRQIQQILDAGELIDIEGQRVIESVIEGIRYRVFLESTEGYLQATLMKLT